MINPFLPGYAIVCNFVSSLPETQFKPFKDPPGRKGLTYTLVLIMLFARNTQWNLFKLRAIIKQPPTYIYIDFDGDLMSFPHFYLRNSLDLYDEADDSTYAYE